VRDIEASWRSGRAIDAAGALVAAIRERYDLKGAPGA
jgi:hypothetical protein